MRKKRKAYISSTKTVACACPNCLHKLDGVTGARLDTPFGRRMGLKGSLTMCAYCAALLKFADDDGPVRMLTEEERDSVHLDPVLEKLYASWREKVKAQQRQAEAFTKTTYN